MTGCSNIIYAAIVPVVISYQASCYYSSQALPLYKIGDDVPPLEDCTEPSSMKANQQE